MSIFSMRGRFQYGKPYHGAIRTRLQAVHSAFFVFKKEELILYPDVDQEMIDQSMPVPSSLPVRLRCIWTAKLPGVIV
jgi:hypothetical protein